jgi:hypothetical protein
MAEAMRGIAYLSAIYGKLQQLGFQVAASPRRAETS